jgi:hypothetical protein
MRRIRRLIPLLAVAAALGLIPAVTSAQGGPAAVTEVPSSIPTSGVFVNHQVQLFPTTTAPTISESQAIALARQYVTNPLPATAVLAQVTVPDTLPPPGSTIPWRSVNDVLAWVVTFTSPQPVNVNVAGYVPIPGGSQSPSPPLYMSHLSIVINATTGSFEEGFFTK